MDSDGGSRNSSPEEKNPKRRMKTPFQLEALERVYAEDRYPTEAVRAELSVHLNLSDQQLQMWFCHKRLKEKKGKEAEPPAGRRKQKSDGSGHNFDGRQMAILEPAHAGMRGPDDDYDEDFEDYHGLMLRPSSAHPMETETEKCFGKVRTPRTVVESSAIAAVKSGMGALLRDDGPELSVDFDSLPIGAFGSSIERKSDWRLPTVPQPLNENRVEESRVEESQETYPSKIGGFGLPPLPAAGVKRKGGFPLGEHNVRAQQLPRPSEEVLFFSEQPVTSEDDHGLTQLNLHQQIDRSHDLVPASTIRSLSHLGSFLPVSMHSTSETGYGFHQERVDNYGINLLPPRESKASRFANGSGLDEAYWRGNYGSISGEGQGAILQSTMPGSGASHLSVGFESLALFQEQEQARMEKKRKREELKLAKESAAYAKRMRKDLERQEVVRQKREEQIRKELEKQDRDKRKEEERAERERQREVERIEREQRREIDRQEKIVLKENKRMEKQQRREELRKAKEAARLKAATERAAAKKLSKEWMDTIEDEQLELLEAPSSHGLDQNGLERGFAKQETSNLLLKKFPPPSLQMEPPLSFCAWTGTDHIAGHFFLVWRFLTTFADVIGLWPFTLDEFGQALSDFDPRLLGEVHVVLIKMIVKDIEGAAEAAASGAGGSQSAINLISGGHPQIVEAAFEWGFDVREWGKYVSPITWPDILRQFALAAGYGPKWRRCSKKMRRSKETEESAEESAVTILRSGVAAANAAALMQGKGVGHLRKCRHRLTPGTVKYAAFHVLSLEGNKGLTILEVAEKIQKSGLRDLTTSKTPEASIAAALSRDTKLFERVAPSTYCVRPAFRKDAEDAEEVLHSARERIHLFQSGILDGEEADKEADEAEEMERDEDYDSDGQDVEDADVRTSISKDSDGKDEIQAELISINNLIDEEVEVDESQVGEPWVQGLMEGEYSDLSIEERLMALVALISVVNEGNGIRLALEGRMEASGTLKRQIWAETQIDRRRHKEEQLSRLQPGSLFTSRNDCTGLSVGADAGSAQISTVDHKPEDHVTAGHNETSPELNIVPFDLAIAPEGPARGESNLAAQERNFSMPEKDTLSQEGLIPRETAHAPSTLTERHRAQGKPDVGILAEELYLVRSLPLGLDRRRNRYWQFVSCGGEQDLSQGRIFFESALDGHWQIIDTEVALDTLLMSLDVRGTREAALHAVLGRLSGSLRRGMKTIEASRSLSQGYGKSDIPKLGIVSGAIQGAGSSPLSCHTGADSSSISGQRLRLQSLTTVVNPTVATVVDFGNTDFEKPSSFERVKDYERWIGSENFISLHSMRASKTVRKRDYDVLVVCTKCHGLYWSVDKYCQTCHQTQGTNQNKQDFHARECELRTKRKGPPWHPCGSSIFVPPRIQVLKCNIIFMEMAVPSEVWKDVWDPQDRKLWASSVKCARTPTELLQALAEIESRMEPGWLSSLFDTSEESLSACKSSCLAVDAGFPPWVPCTSAAVGLRMMMVFDAALAFSSEQKRSQKQVEEDILLSRSTGSFSHTMHDLATFGNPRIEDNGEVYGDPIGGSVRGRGRGRGRGKGARRSESNLVKNGTHSTLKKNSKRKHQEEISAVETQDVRQVKIGGPGQRGARGRPRGNGMGRPRGRGSRGTHRNQNIIKRMRKLRKEKDPNQLITRKAPSKKTVLEYTKVPAGGESSRECENDAVKKSKWELEGPLEVEHDENMGTIVKEDVNDLDVDV